MRIGRTPGGEAGLQNERLFSILTDRLGLPPSRPAGKEPGTMIPTSATTPRRGGFPAKYRAALTWAAWSVVALAATLAVGKYGAILEACLAIGLGGSILAVVSTSRDETEGAPALRPGASPGMAEEIPQETLEFLACVLHDLKSPLAASLMNAQSLAGGHLGPLNEKQTWAAQALVRNLRQFGGRLTQFLEMSRIERGLLEVRAAPCRLLAEIVDPVLDEQAPLIKKWRIEIVRDVDPGLTIEADPVLLHSVVQNLVSNAVNYGEQGGTVAIRAASTGDAATLRVHNTGPGIKAEHLPHLFAKFFRGGVPELTGQRGSGLGLYLASRIVAAHGGAIRADTEEGRWAEFTITLPLTQPGAPKKEKP
jgi:signal transduction histidine kinase